MVILIRIAIAQARGSLKNFEEAKERWSPMNDGRKKQMKQLIEKQCEFF